MLPDRLHRHGVAATRAIAAVAVAVVLTLVLGACGSNQPVADTGAVPSTAAGKDIYAQKCAVCHGANGEGAAGPRLNEGATKAKYLRPEIEELLVRDGQNAMPSFGTSLTPAQISAVVAYTRSL